VARGLALAAAIAVSLLAVSGAGGAGTQQTPKRGGTVVVPGLFGGGREPACLNVWRECGADDAFDHVSEVLEGAFELEPDRVRPNLVTRVEFTRTPPFTLTYHIRPEARWSDGTPVSARDFVFTHQVEVAYPGVVPLHKTWIRSVRMVGPKTVRVVLRSRFAFWRDFFSMILPEHALRGAKLEEIWTDGIDDPRTGRPIGSGPFLVERFDRGRQLVLRRNPGYWGQHTAYLDRLVIRFGIEDPVEALRTGALDVYQVRLGLDPDGARARARIPGVRQLYADGIRWEHFEIRGWAPGGHPALRNKTIRRALAYGIDRDALVREVFGEFVPTLRPVESAVFLPASPHYEPNWRRYRSRPELARRLFEQAGCRPGSDGIYECAGERLSLRFVAGAGVPSRSRALDLVQAQLKRVGVEVRPVYVPGRLYGEYIERGEWDLTLISYFYFPHTPVDFAFRCEGPVNVTGYCQRLVTRELDQAARTLDPLAYGRALNRADVQMAQDVPVIPLWNEPIAVTVRSTLRGFVPSDLLVAWNAENWWLER